jgi:hypothetical protein
LIKQALFQIRDYVAGSAGSMLHEGSGSGLDPMDISDPASAYFLLSDDAQNKITGTDKEKMKYGIP